MERINSEPSALHKLTEEWGSQDSVTLYLDRCQVDTPHPVVTEVWCQINKSRRKVGKVVDFGAGDARFSKAGKYAHYIGYEIDATRCRSAELPTGATLVNQCAFLDIVEDADVCIGNPPYVRNQDLPIGWRQLAAQTIFDRTGIRLSGLANAWQYFFSLGLASTKKNGLVALVIPYEWVSRPSASAIRDHIAEKGWNVSVYRLRDDTFRRVLTTSSITIIDKRSKDGEWKYFEQTPAGDYTPLASPSGAISGVVQYERRVASKKSPHAKRGLSPGTQEVFTLTEGERVRLGLKINIDVVPCVTSLRKLSPSKPVLTEKIFKQEFRLSGAKCWLIRPDKATSPRVAAYLDSVPQAVYDTKTCMERENWWEFSMPKTPSLLLATGFRGASPKVISNQIGARAVGGVCGIYGVPKRATASLAKKIRALDLSDRIVAHSNGLKKIEINQLNAILSEISTTDFRPI